MKCTEKQPFETRAEAYRFTQYMIHHQRKIRLYIYECPYCGKYHVTHKKQNFKRAESKTKTGDKKHKQYYEAYREWDRESVQGVCARPRVGLLEKREKRQQRYPRWYFLVAGWHALSTYRIQEGRKGVHQTRAIHMEKQIPECCVFRFKFRPIQENTAPIGAVFFF